MKWLDRLAVVVLGVTGIAALRRFMENYQLVLINKEDIIHDEEDQSRFLDMDLRGTPTHVCVCGCTVFNLRVTFEDSVISSYLLDMECVNCGSLATAPTPIDNLPGTNEK